MKANLVSLGPAVVASRMVRDYTEELYEPTALSAESLRSDEFAAAKELSAWKARVRGAWGGVKVTDVEASDEPAELGADRTVTVTVELGGLTPGDIEVQLVHGRVAQHDELTDTTTSALTCADPSASPATYSGTVSCSTPGRYGFAVRAIPTHPGLPTPLDLGLTTHA